MNGFKTIGIALLVLGLLGMAYGGFSFTRETHEAKVGPLSLSVKERQTVNIPIWVGGAAVVAGVMVLVAGGKR